MKNGKYQLGIIGFGGMGSWHYNLIQTIDCLEVSGIWDILEDRRSFAESKGIHAYSSLEDMLADPELDLVLVSTPNDFHKPIVIQALKSGKNAVSEKPVTLSTADLDCMIDASKQTGKFFTVHQNRRWDEDFLTMKEIYESGKLGHVFRIESRVHGSRGIPGDWRQLPEKGGGMVLDWGIHILDQAMMLMKGKKLVSVYANKTNITNELVDDGYTAYLTFDDGTVYMTEVGTNNFISLPRWYMLGNNGTAAISDWGKDAQIITACGTTEADVVPVITAAGLTKTMAPRRKENISEEIMPEVKSDIRDFYRNVCGVIAGKEEPAVKLEEVRRVMKVVEAIFHSINENQVIAFDDN